VRERWSSWVDRGAGFCVCPGLKRVDVRKPSRSDCLLADTAVRCWSGVTATEMSSQHRINRAGTGTKQASWDSSSFLAAASRPAVRKRMQDNSWHASSGRNQRGSWGCHTRQASVLKNHNTRYQGLHGIGCPAAGAAVLASWDHHMECWAGGDPGDSGMRHRRRHRRILCW
jgi:hypothetical protein